MFQRKRKPSDFAAEINAHLELEVERLKEQGLTEEAARATARRWFGNVTRAAALLRIGPLALVGSPYSRPPLRPAYFGQESQFYGRRGADAGARHWGQYYDIQLR